MPQGTSQRDERFAFIGGRLVLDFANTRAWGPVGLDDERLRTFDDVLDWGLESNAIPAERHRKLRDLALCNPATAGRALERTRLVRELLHRLLVAIAAGDRADPSLVAAFNERLGRSLERLRLAPTADSLLWADGNGGDLDAVLHPVLWSAAELLSSSDRTRLRRCANPACGWLFVDESRNGMRRWCEMSECGNRAKARRYYARRRNRPSRTPLD